MPVSPKMDGKMRHLRVFPPVVTWGDHCTGPMKREDEFGYCPNLNHVDGDRCLLFRQNLSTTKSNQGHVVAIRAAACTGADEGDDMHRKRMEEDR